ncbi:MAG: MMPL family transporter, partial [Gammaproteobacteria bacterium]
LFYERVRYVFGSEESVVVALASADAFSADALGRIGRMTERLQRLPNVHHVLSLTTAKSLRADESGIEFTGAGERDFTDPVVREDLRSDILDNPLYRGTLVSDDRRASALIVYFEGLSDNDFAELGLTQQIYAIADEERGEARVWVTGAPVIKAAISSALMDSFRVTVPAIVIIVSVVLLLAFRSIRAVLLPVLAISMALIWTLGLLAWLGRPLNVVTILVPPLLITLGLAYSMHVVSEYYSASRRIDPGSAPLDRRRLIGSVLRHVGLPLIISGATTAVGLLALSLNSLSAIREFSLLSVVGVTFAALIVLTFIPAALGLLQPPTRAAEDVGAGVFKQVSRRLIDLDRRRRRPILIGGLVALVIAIVGTAQIEVGTAYTGGLAEDLRARTDFEAINAAFGGANSFYIVIDSPDEDTFVEPANLARLESLQNWLEQQPEVGSTTSLADHIKLINQTMHDGDSAFHTIPESKPLAKQLLFFGGAEDLDSYVDSTYRSANILVRINVDDTREISRLVEQTQAQLRKFPYPLEPRVTGNLVLVTRTLNDIARGQLLSISAALLVVLTILSAMFTSLRTGLTALLPNVLVVAIYFGALGLLGITLNTTTSLIACIALGIAVDDTIHFMVRFNTEARDTGQEGTAVQRALASVIRPVTYTSIVVVLSFLVLTTSELRSQVQFGALAAFTVAVAWLLDLTLTPALSSGMRVVTLWDILRLDLGRQPQQSIPVFEDLSLRQARTFALLADIKTYEAGAILMTEGEKATDEFFVVIDGELQAWVDRDGHEIELSRMKRGSTIGEAGLFGRNRGASVRVIEPARLLRFTVEDLDLLCRRYSKIAALVYRNLNRVQAERAARDLSRVH